MTPTNAEPEPPSRRPRWLWVLAGLALGWSILVRIPIVRNAEVHLESDLAVDGLCVADVVRGGNWHWHFPGTPHIGIASAVFAGPQLALWGLDPVALSSGGVAEYAALGLAVFLLAWTVFGPRVAAWCLVPLAFSSTGMIWHTSRLNAGHLLAATWHAGALALLASCLRRGGFWRSAGLGLWCGLGLWHDWMFVMTVAALVPVAIVAWWVAGHPRSGWRCALAFALGLALGDLPREVGNRIETYNAYPEQFSPILKAEVLTEHTRILLLECLPRLVAGHLLPDLRAAPAPEVVHAARPSPRRPGEVLLAGATSALALGLFVAGLGALARRGRGMPADVPQAAVRGAILLSSAAIAVGFVLNRNIFDSDNYRYIIDLFVTWVVGFGLAMDRLARRGRLGLLAASGLALGLAALMTLDTARWYERFGWIDDRLRPVRRWLHDPALDWLRAHPEVTSIYGGYWDVYRLTFLTRGRVRGVPFPPYPDRYPEWARAEPGGRPEILIVRPTPEGWLMRRRAVREGARPLRLEPALAIYDWPRRP